MAGASKTRESINPSALSDAQTLFEALAQMLTDATAQDAEAVESEDYVSLLRELMGGQSAAEVFGFSLKALDSFEALATSLLKAHQHKRAQAVFALLTHVDPQRGSAWRGFGVTKLRQHALEDAELAFRKAVELDENDASSWVLLGEMLLKYRLDDALLCLERAARIQSPQPHLARASVKARALLQRVQSESDPNTRPAEVMISADAAHEKQSRVEQAQGHASASSDSSGVSPEPDSDLGLAFSDVQSDSDLMSALAELSAAWKTGQVELAELVDIDDARLESGYQTVLALGESQRYTEALMTGLFLVLLQPQSRLLHVLGVLLLGQEKFEWAVGLFDLAARFESQNSLKNVHPQGANDALWGEALVRGGHIEAGVQKLKAAVSVLKTTHHADTPRYLERAEVLLKTFHALG